MKKKILISAYAISPARGSEYGAAWNTVMHLAKEHELWVLYGMSDNHMGDTQTLRAYLKNNTIPSVTFVEVRPSKLANAINLLNKIGLGWFFYFAYYLWQKEALKAAKVIVNEVNIDVMHQLGPIGFREPGFLGRLNKPLVWGPIGGMNIVHKDMFTNKPLATRLKFSVKNSINFLQLNFSNRIREAFYRADVLIAATLGGQQTIRDRFGLESYYLPEQGVIGEITLDESKFDRVYDEVQLVWSGSHIERKNFDLCLDALAAVEQKNWVLHVLGTGPLTQRLKEKADTLGLSDHVKWHGHLQRNEAMKIMSLAHLHIITSIAEDNPAVTFEALSAGVPTLTLDHCGMGDVICNRCGIKILTGTHEQMTHTMASSISHLLLHPYILKDMAHGVPDCARKHSWDARLEKLNTIYTEAIKLHGRPYKYPVNEDPLTVLQDA
jgi:glycosyltransferase involved in cell wall biosynthesis